MEVSAHEAPVPAGIERIRAHNPGPLALTGTNTYLVGEPAFVIDPGPADAAHIESVWEAAVRRGGIEGIAITHRHIDHAGAAAVLRERSRAPLAAAPEPRERSRVEEAVTRGLEVDVVLADGDAFGPLRAIATPGHAADHLAYIHGTVLFSGDAILGVGSVVIAPGEGGLGAYLHALRRLLELDLTTICPGHGPVVEDAHAKVTEYIEHRLDRERRLVAALDRGLRRRSELLDAAWDDVPAVLRPAAALALEAHLEKLEAEQRLPEGVERLVGGVEGLAELG